MIARLDRDAPPDQVFLATAGVENEQLQDLFAVEREALGVTLTTGCAPDRRIEGVGLSLAEAVRMVQDRLDVLRSAAGRQED